MIAILNAIYGKKASSSFDTAIGGRFFENEAPEGTPYPYSVYKVVSRGKMRTFSSKYLEPLIQISIFSSSSESTEIETIYAAQDALFDECTLTVSGHTFIDMRLESDPVGPYPEEHTTTAGTRRVLALHSDYRVMVKV